MVTEHSTDTPGIDAGPLGMPFPGIAKKIWPYADDIIGEGPFVLAVHTPDRTVVMLWYWPDDALDAYLELTHDGVDPTTLSMFDLRNLEQAGKAAARHLRTLSQRLQDLDGEAA